MFSCEICEIFRSSRTEMHFKIGVLRKFAMFTGRHLCWSLFLIRFQAWKPATLSKKTPTKVFSCEYTLDFFNKLLVYKQLQDCRERGAGWRGALALPPPPHHLLEQKKFFPRLIGKHKIFVKLFHLNNKWDFGLFIEQDITDKK